METWPQARNLDGRVRKLDIEGHCEGHAHVSPLRWQGAHLVEETRLYVRRVLLVRKTGLDGGLRLMILESVL